MPFRIGHFSLFLLSSLPSLAGDWPEWRGSSRTGAGAGEAPLEFSDTKNVVWKAAIPGRGFSSPIIVGDRVFLTTAVAGAEAAPTPAAQPGPAGQGRRPGGGGAGGGAGAGREYNFLLMALDRNSGKPLWERVAKTATPHEGYHGRYGSFASNSPVSDGKRVYAFFGSRGVYCYDLTGKLVWSKDFPPMRMRLQFGEGAAPVLHDDTLLLKFDQEEGSYILALDKNSGKELWRAARSESSSWAPPLVVEHNGSKQAVVSASNKVRSYDLRTGQLIWESAGLGSNVIPAPVALNDVVYVMSGHREPNLLAIKLGRTGDLTGSDAVLWTNQRGNAYTPSPVLLDGKLYLLTDNGQLTCLDAATGKPFYQQQRLPKPYNFKASPVAVNGRLYLSSEEGDVIVVKLGEKFEVLTVNTMADQMFVASPALDGKAMYLRGQNTLFCVR